MNKINNKENAFDKNILDEWLHELRTPSEEIAFTALPKIKSQSQIFRYSRSIFCLPHRPKFSDFSDLCLHWVSVVREWLHAANSSSAVVIVRNMLCFSNWRGTMDTRWLNPKFFVAQIQIPNKYLEFGYKGFYPPKSCLRILISYLEF